MFLRTTSLLNFAFLLCLKDCSICVQDLEWTFPFLTNLLQSTAIIPNVRNERLAKFVFDYYEIYSAILPAWIRSDAELHCWFGAIRIFCQTVLINGYFPLWLNSDISIYCYLCRYLFIYPEGEDSTRTTAHLQLVVWQIKHETNSILCWSMHLPDVWNGGGESLCNLYTNVVCMILAWRSENYTSEMLIDAVTVWFGPSKWA